jgi:hypothetical protein
MSLMPQRQTGVFDISVHQTPCQRYVVFVYVPQSLIWIASDSALNLKKTMLWIALYGHMAAWRWEVPESLADKLQLSPLS